MVDTPFAAALAWHRSGQAVSPNAPSVRHIEAILARYSVLYTELLKHAAAAQSKERVRLRELLELPAEPCKVWENDGTMYCSTHAEFWHRRDEKPAVACFADQSWNA